MIAVEDDRDQAKFDLWSKLLAGGVTEVYAPGFEGYIYPLIRYTLGLEPIDSRAYEYDREGVPRDATELEDVARQLAAQPRWIAGGGPWFWDTHFAERAEVILVFATSDDDWHRRNNEHPVDYIDRTVRWLAHRAGSRRREKSGAIENSSPLDMPFLQAVSSRSTLSPMETAIAHVREQCPEKVFIVSEWNRSGRLEAVRAR
jgi:hypothetical protein